VGRPETKRFDAREELIKMAVKIRLRREGRRNRAFYRVVVADSRSPRDGRYIEQVGYYDPMTEPANIKLEKGRIDFWIGQGAQPSDTVKNLLVRSSVATTDSASIGEVTSEGAETPQAAS